ncbi:hypothetical protein CGZ65_06240 [Neisseria weixii]|nr:hypothetical protein CGZ65_06240 [Neisseria weixii]
MRIVAVYRVKYSRLRYFSDGLTMINTRIPATAAMLVKNSERYLVEVLTALGDFDEVLLLDNGSTDRTFEIAAQFKNVSYFKHDFIGFGPMKTWPHVWRKTIGFSASTATKCLIRS